MHWVQANELLDRLHGKKYLIQGNHDSFLRDKGFDRSKFVWIRDYAKLNIAGQKVILFYYPIAVWDCQHHGSIHLYEYIYGNGTAQHPLIKKLINAYNVGVDVNGFELVTFEELRNR